MVHKGKEKREPNKNGKAGGTACGAEPETGARTEPEARTGAGAEPEPGTGTEAEPEPGMGTKTEPEPRTKPKAGT